MYRIFTLFLINAAILISSDADYKHLPSTSDNSIKSSLNIGSKASELGGAFNIKVLNGTRSSYNRNDESSEVVTRQIPNASYLYKQNVKSVVLVGNGSGMGAGVIIGKHEIITNYHVVENAEKVDLVLYNKSISTLKQIPEKDILEAEVFAVDKERDLALVTTDINLHNIVLMGKNWEIDIAQDVFAIGHPAGLWGFTYGVISALPTPKEWEYDDGSTYMANCIQTQTPINPGNSGGPLLSSSGKLIGINTSTAEGEGLNFAVRLDEVKDFITKARKGYYPRGKKEGLNWVEIDDHGIESVNELWGADSNGDGYYDVWLAYEGNHTSDKDIVDIRLFDVNYDGDFDILHNVSEEIFFIDTDYNGAYDLMGIDTDDDWKPDQFEDYADSD